MTECFLVAYFYKKKHTSSKNNFRVCMEQFNELNVCCERMHDTMYSFVNICKKKTMVIHSIQFAVRKLDDASLFLFSSEEFENYLK